MPAQQELVDIESQPTQKITIHGTEAPVSPTSQGYIALSSKGVFNKAKKPSDIKWSNVCFNVKDKTILKDCWGNVPTGTVCAIMGPSGSGKSSLLNVLAGRSAPAPGIAITGQVSVGGVPINPVAYRQNIAYVMQDDALMATAHPREALEFSAHLRLPAGTTSEEINTRVTALLEALGLEDCQDTMIGGALIKGISGGQRKRTSVGVELITDPSLLFLDEPTSGLDSYSAHQLVSLLTKVAKNNNAAMLCTIHQPSSEVFFLFDQVIFLKEGRVFYQGPVSGIVSYFSTFGKEYKCHENYNPSDFVMHICETEKAKDENGLTVLDRKGMFMDKPPKGFSDSKEEGSVANTMQEVSVADFVTTSGFSKQMYWLMYREYLNVSRDIAALIGRFGITIMLSLLYGLIFLNAGDKDDSVPDNFNAHFGAITMNAISSMFGTAQPVMLMFPFERPMFMREYSTGTYSAVSYFVSKVAWELPLAFVQTIFQFLLVYYISGFQGNFILLVLASWGLGIASSSVAVVLGCLVSDVKDVTEMAPLLFVPQLLFAGFFIRLSQVPVFLRWAQYLCSLKYAMNLILMIEFNPSLDSCQGGAKFFCDNVLTSNEIDTSKWWVYIIILAVLFAGFRTLGCIILARKAKRFY